MQVRQQSIEPEWIYLVIFSSTWEFQELTTLNNIRCCGFLVLTIQNQLCGLLLKNAEEWHLHKNVCFQNKDNIKLISPAASLPTAPQDSLNEKMIMYLMSTEHPGEKKSML